MTHAHTRRRPSLRRSSLGDPGRAALYVLGVVLGVGVVVGGALSLMLGLI